MFTPFPCIFINDFNNHKFFIKMKRVLLFAVAILSVLFTSCTDNTLDEIEKRNNEELEIFIYDKGEIQSPKDGRGTSA